MMDPEFAPKRRIRPLDWIRASALIAIALHLSGCERGYWDPTLKISAPQDAITASDQERRRDAFRARGGETAETIALGDEAARSAKTDTALQRGTGTFVRSIAPPEADTAPGDVTLNFDGTDIREVVKVILGDLLQVNYVLHPAVQGSASLQTGRPLRREHLLPTLETLLRMNNAALVNKGGTYEVMPLANAIRGQQVPQLGASTRALPEGYSIQVAPLRYIGAEEMSSILQPLAPEGSIIRVDTLRNLLVIAGTSPEIANLLETIRVFDVDWMAGLSVGFFVLEYAKSNEVATQLQNLLAEEGANPLKGVFRFIPVESANALLVVSPQASYIEQARNWIERLDMAEATGDAATRLYVYRVRHGDAENLADILSKLFGGDGGKSESRSVGGVAPGLASGSIGGDGSGSGSGGGGSGTPRASARNLELSSAVSIVADAVNNSLLVKSSPRDYKKILDALKQLDIVPLQVLVEATIVEISLTGSLKYGVQWDLYGLATESRRSRFTLSGNKDGNIGSVFPGFNWAIISRPSTIRATLSALAGENLVNVLSAPSVMVLDNQTAKINVGKEVPIATSQSQGTSEDDRLTSTINYKPTGVMLSVKPRVTPGGLVQMEIEQEVSTAEATDSSTLNSPTISSRKITSSVAVRSNQSVVLGGLIQNQRTDGKSGVPGFYDLPFAGPLFGQRNREATRTELVVVLTPKVISSDQDIDAVTSDFRGKLHGLEFKF